MNREHRGHPRHRTRLRSGKLADLQGRFIADCAVYDRSAEGARLRLTQNAAIPDRLLLFDDESGVLLAANVVRRSGVEIGLRFERAPDSPATKEIAKRLSGKYYAL